MVAFLQMVTYYCPHCWTILDEKDQVCPKCGYVIKDYQDSSYEDKLLNALHHPVPERRIMAAQVLGILGSQRALVEFLKILESGSVSDRAHESAGSFP